MRIKKRFWLCRRGRVFYAWDTQTDRRVSLETRIRTEAQRVIDAKNIAVEQPGLNLALAKAYLSGVDPQLPKRTWEDVMEEFAKRDRKSIVSRPIR